MLSVTNGSFAAKEHHKSGIEFDTGSEERKKRRSRKMLSQKNIKPGECEYLDDETYQFKLKVSK